jgi:hypothetical protein
VYIYKTRLPSKEIFSPSNKIHREVGRAKDLSAPRVKGNFFDRIMQETLVYYRRELGSIPDEFLRHGALKELAVL